MIKRYLTTIILPALVLAFLVPAATAFALYEPENPQSNVATSLDPVQGPAEDLVVSWTAPIMSGTDSIIGYVYKWTTSSTAPPLNQDDKDGIVDKELNSLITSKTFFANDDEDVLRYLHIRTVYMVVEGGDPEKLSDIVTVGPFNFDNVKPVGPPALLDDDVPGQEADASSVNPVTIKVFVTSAFEAKVYMREGTTGDRPASPRATIPEDGGETTFTGSARFSFVVADWQPGTQKTLSYWLQDKAGNISDRRFLTFNMLAGKSVVPAGDLVLETGETITFTILGKGATETFDWEIIEADPADVASFADANANVDEVTVQGDQEGTFKVQATSKADGLVYTSGTVEVVSLTLEITHTYASGLNLVPFSLTGTGVLTAADLRDAIESANGGVMVLQVFGWDGGNQRYGSAYVVIGGTGFFDFDLVEGAAYFVQTDGPGSLTLSGQDYESFQLNQGLNLMSVPPGHAATISSAADFEDDITTKTGLEVSQIFGWDEANQRYGSAYVVIGGTGFFDFDLSIEDHGYFVQTNGGGTYTP